MRHAMVLAAGRGVRMRPLSDVLPKPALPLPGGPLVKWSLRQVAAAGCERITVNTWHLADRMQVALEQTVGLTEAVELVVSRERDLLGTAGGLAAARDTGLLGSHGPVLVANGDVVQSLDLQPLVDRHERAEDEVTLALLPHLDPRRWSRVGLDRDGRVAAIRPAGEPDGAEVPLLYTGVMLMGRTAVERIPTGPGQIADHVWRPALEARRLGGVVVTGSWSEVGTPKDYLETVLERCGGEPVIEQGADVDATARVGWGFVTTDSSVAAEAVVTESAVVAGARIGRGARVIRSVIMGPVEVPAGTTVTGRFVVDES